MVLYIYKKKGDFKYVEVHYYACCFYLAHFLPVYALVLGKCFHCYAARRQDFSPPYRPFSLYSLLPHRSHNQMLSNSAAVCRIERRTETRSVNSVLNFRPGIYVNCKLRNYPARNLTKSQHKRTPNLNITMV